MYLSWRLAKEVFAFVGPDKEQHTVLRNQINDIHSLRARIHPRLVYLMPLFDKIIYVLLSVAVYSILTLASPSRFLIYKILLIHTEKVKASESFGL
jgi:hypothetical protein